ncbi:hypothetical protein KJ765_02755 [Candidatus Micrarchaeota archaeon]|nr:hypothetical protein [Candidatus Micrarchaeota archaeon]
MGLFNRLFRKQKAPEPPREPIHLSWTDVDSFVNQLKEKSLQPTLSDAQRLMDGIQSDFKHLQEIMGSLFQKPLESDNIAFHRIAKQMKTNYLKRVSQAQEIRVPPRTDYHDVDAFQRSVLEQLQNLNKIASDNRYLIAMYREDFENMGLVLKELVKKTDALGRWLDGLRPRIQRIDRIQDSMKRMAESEREIQESEKRLTELLQSIDNMPVESSAEVRRLEPVLRDIRSQISNVQSSGSLAKSEALSLITSLQRLFRKFGRVCLEKDTARTARDYSENAWDALSAESPGHPHLLKLCTEIEKSLKKGDLESDEKQNAKARQVIRRILEGGVDKPFRRTQEIDKQLADLERRRLDLEGEQSVQRSQEWERGHLQKQYSLMKSKQEAAAESRNRLIQQLKKDLETLSSDPIAFDF